MPKFPLISHRGTTFKPSEFIVKTPVTGQTGPVNRSNQSEPVARALLNSTGFRSNRSGKLLPEGGGLTGPVGFGNPATAGVKSSARQQLALLKMIGRTLVTRP